MKHLNVLLLFIFSLFAISSEAKSAPSVKDTSTTSKKHSVLLKDNPIVAALDSLALLKCFQKSHTTIDIMSLNKYHYAPNFVPVFSDSIYKLRIARLNAKSPFGLVYNEDVKSFIDLYAVKKRQTTCRLLGLAEYYFPIFEEYLNKYDIPLELKYVAIIESALIPVNKSWAGAGGLWQFVYGTGKMYGLEITSYVDDRFDPVKSTIAACEYFKDLYSLYKDWSLVLAAYNSGAGNVNKAIRRSNGETNFWKIKQYLPRETQGYVPAFIAVVYVMNYASEHNLYPVAPDFLSFETDTVTVKQKLTFDQISEALNIPLDEITFLNPAFKEKIIPSFGDERYTLRLPKKNIGDFMTNETSIYNYKTKAMLEEEKILAEKQKEARIKDSLATVQKNLYKKNNYNANNTQSGDTYTVMAGDGLGLIASKYNCTVAQIMDWNKMKNMSIYPGQKLYVQDPAKIAAKPDSSLAKKEEKKEEKTEKKEEIKVKREEIKELKQEIKSESNTSKTIQASNITVSGSQNIKYVYHTVQPGDTLWGIAIQYKGSTVEEIQRLNNLTNNSLLYIGQKLKVAVAL
ncbi:MAG: LysM peptidoglycan-binding domain-containing protein [Bacteroidales bacterium]|jgi:membrane-bound lytic murein transglycosylase D